MISWEYAPITRDEYFQLTQFDKSSSRPMSYQDLVTLEKTRGELHINRVEITRLLAEKILKFIDENELSTRGPIPDIADTQMPHISHTVFTVRFSLHIVAGKRGGWYILECGGREPRIKDEFIEYGPRRRSGRRKNRYRRNLSYSEQNQVDFLKSKTPALDQLYRWIMKKYPSEVRSIDVRFSNDPFPF